MRVAGVVAAIVVSLLVVGSTQAGGLERYLTDEGREIVQYASRDRQLRDEFVECVLRCGAQTEKAAEAKCRKECVEWYLGRLEQMRRDEKGGGNAARK